jgi:hypothetical protein
MNNNDGQPPSIVIPLQQEQIYLRLPHTKTKTFNQQKRKPYMCMAAAIAVTLKAQPVHLKMAN